MWILKLLAVWSVCAAYSRKDWVRISIDDLEAVVFDAKAQLQKLYPDDFDLAFERGDVFDMVSDSDDDEKPLTLRVGKKPLFLKSETHILIKEGRTRCFQSSPKRVSAIAITPRDENFSARVLIGCKCGRYDDSRIELLCPNPDKLHSMIVKAIPDMTHWVPVDHVEHPPAQTSWTGILWLNPVPNDVRSWQYPITLEDTLPEPQSLALAQTLNYVSNTVTLTTTLTTTQAATLTTTAATTTTTMTTTTPTTTTPMTTTTPTTTTPMTTTTLTSTTTLTTTTPSTTTLTTFTPSVSQYVTATEFVTEEDLFIESSDVDLSTSEDVLEDISSSSDSKSDDSDTELPVEPFPDEPFEATLPIWDLEEEKDTTEESTYNVVQLLPAEPSRTSDAYPAAAVWPGEEDSLTSRPTNNEFARETSALNADTVHQIIAEGPDLESKDTETIVVVEKKKKKPAPPPTKKDEEPKKEDGGFLTALVKTDDDDEMIEEVVILEEEVEETTEETTTTTTTLKPILLRVDEVDHVGAQLIHDRVMAPVASPPKPTATVRLAEPADAAAAAYKNAEVAQAEAQQALALASEAVAEAAKLTGSTVEAAKLTETIAEAATSPAVAAKLNGPDVVVEADMAAAVIDELEKFESSELPEAEKEEIKTFFPPTSSPAVIEQERSINTLLLTLLAQRDDLTLAQKLQIMSLVMSSQTPPAHNGVQSVKIIERGA